MACHELPNGASARRCNSKNCNRALRRRTTYASTASEISDGTARLLSGTSPAESDGGGSPGRSLGAAPRPNSPQVETGRIVASTQVLPAPPRGIARTRCASRYPEREEGDRAGDGQDDRPQTKRVRDQRRRDGEEEGGADPE